MVGVEGSLHSGTIYGITSLIAGTSLLFGMFKIEATQGDSYENCSANLMDRSFMSSRKGEKHLQRVRQPVTEMRSEMNIPDANTVDGA